MRATMNKIFAIALITLLSGCATPFAPYAIDVRDQSAYDADLAACRVAAAHYPRGFAFGDTITATVEGAGNNLAEAAVDPLIPVLGAAGAGGATVWDSVDPFRTLDKKIVTLCMEKKGERSGQYMVLEPKK
jgi:hypothetical protein